MKTIERVKFLMEEYRKLVIDNNLDIKKVFCNNCTHSEIEDWIKEEPCASCGADMLIYNKFEPNKEYYSL